MKRFLFFLILAGVYVGDANAQEAVDLGLSVNWATYNVGATAPEEKGGLFICGTKEPWSNNIKTSETNLYVTHSYDYSGDTEYDMAAAIWGNGWRTPTKMEWDELISKCKWKKAKIKKSNGVTVVGMMVTGPNGNSIFLPSTEKHHFGGVDRYGFYQSSTPFVEKGGMWIVYMQCVAGKYLHGMWYKYSKMFNDVGFATRPVIDK